MLGFLFKQQTKAPYRQKQMTAEEQRIFDEKRTAARMKPFKSALERCLDEQKGIGVKKSKPEPVKQTVRRPPPPIPLGNLDWSDIPTEYHHRYCENDDMKSVHYDPRESQTISQQNANYMNINSGMYTIELVMEDTKENEEKYGLGQMQVVGGYRRVVSVIDGWVINKPTSGGDHWKVEIRGNDKFNNCMDGTYILPQSPDNSGRLPLYIKSITPR